MPDRATFFLTRFWNFILIILLLGDGREKEYKSIQCIYIHICINYMRNICKIHAKYHTHTSNRKVLEGLIIISVRIFHKTIARLLMVVSFTLFQVWNCEPETLKSLRDL